MEILAEILEDLRFYREMALTPTEILLGEKVYREILQECNSRIFLSSATSEPSFCALFGINVRLEPKFAPWARSYRFKEALG